MCFQALFLQRRSSGGSGMIRSKLLLAGLALVGSNLLVVPAQAQGLLDIGRALLGLPTEEKEPIEYRERAPLVVPPTQNLRPPVEAGDAASRRANWPQDPDALERRRAAEEARRPRSVESITARDAGTGRRLTVDEIRAGRVAGQEVVRQPEGNLDIVQRQSNVFGGLAAIREMDRRSAGAEANLAREEPRREFLTDPPKGLRQPSDRAAFKATREGSLGVQKEPTPFDIYKEGPNTR
jgi:hypothetical protein